MSYESPPEAFVGERVTWNGRPGIVRHVGPVFFAAGDWVGIELNTPLPGVAEVNGCRESFEYFTCPTDTAVWCLSKHRVGNQPVDAAAQAKSSSASARLRETAANPTPGPGPAPAQARLETASRAAAPPVQTGSSTSQAVSAGNVTGKYVGQRVTWSQKPGTVRYVGEVPWRPGEVWIGIELDVPQQGMHDGTMLGRRYFTAPPNTGVMCPVTGAKPKRTRRQPRAKRNEAKRRRLEGAVDGASADGDGPSDAEDGGDSAFEDI